MQFIDRFGNSDFNSAIHIFKHFSGDDLNMFSRNKQHQ